MLDSAWAFAAASFAKVSFFLLATALAGILCLLLRRWHLVAKGTPTQCSMCSASFVPADKCPFEPRKVRWYSTSSDGWVCAACICDWLAESNSSWLNWADWLEYAGASAQDPYWRNVLASIVHGWLPPLEIASCHHSGANVFWTSVEASRQAAANARAAKRQSKSPAPTGKSPARAGKSPARATGGSSKSPARPGKSPARATAGKSPARATDWLHGCTAADDRHGGPHRHIVGMGHAE